MAAPMMYHTFVGTELGLLKGYNYCKNSWENLNSVSEAEKSNEICALCWNSNAEIDISVGLKSNRVLTFSVEQQSFTSEISLDFGEGKLRNIYHFDDHLISAASSGAVKVWNDSSVKCEFSAGKDLFVMDHCTHQSNLIATGGKENELKVWDISNASSPLFEAKNVKNDWLNLRVPVWIVKCQFINQTTEKIVTSTGHHQVRLYDTKTQRRPVLDMSFDEYPLTALAVNNTNPNQIVVGNTQGKMALLDIRKGAVIQQYRGFAGGIRDIKCHTSKPIIASCSVDRNLRFHDLHSKVLLNKVYLKSRLNCLLLSSTDWSHEEKDDSKIVQTYKQEQASDEEEIWQKMEVVKTKTKRKLENVEQYVFPSNENSKIDNISRNSMKKKRKIKKNSK